MIYLGQPYSHEDPAVMKKRYFDGLRATAYCIQELDHKVYSPIVHSRPIILLLQQLGSGQHTFEYWRKYDINILRRCDELRVLVLDGWKESVGLQAEIEAAKAIHLKTTYMDMQLVDEWVRFHS